MFVNSKDSAALDLKNNFVSVQYLGAGFVMVAVTIFVVV
jgi:hypothetical protein